jgi:nitrogen fixation/metabolism regulation signal transduction histidine kinase
LTLVVLLTLLAAIYGAIFSAQRLTRPVQDLIAGTRAVGKGDFGTRLPLPSRDEMGFLVHSFNDMTKRLKRASEEAKRSRQAVEHERERLSIILSRLSTGVIVTDRAAAPAQRQSIRRHHPRWGVSGARWARIWRS